MYDRDSPFQARPIQAGADKDAAYERLRGTILDCTLHPGELVSEGGLAARFQFGKAAVRSALARLSETRLVRALPRRGWQVVPLAGSDVADLVRARRAVEPSLATVLLTATQAAELRRLADMAIAASHHPHDMTSARAFDRQFRSELAQRIGNPFLTRWCEETWDLCDRILALDPSAAPGQRRALVDAIASGRAEQARDLITQDIAMFEHQANRILLARAKITITTPHQSDIKRQQTAFPSKESFR